MGSSNPPPAAGRSWTIGRVVKWATEDFGKRGFDSARLDAELLLAHALKVDRVRLIIDADRPLTRSELAAYRQLIQRRRGREPVAYIRGIREFYGLEFRVDRRVLIPRPDTETLVDVGLERTRARHLFGRALDLCTGSGCVAIAFARRRPTWQVTGVDIDAGAVSVARENAVRLGAASSVGLVEGDLLAPIPEPHRFDLIVANPPYIPRAELAEQDPGIRDFEPTHALDGGSDGLELVRRIVQAAPARLAPAGVMATEIGCQQADRVAALFEQAGLQQIERHRDCGGQQRVVSGCKP